MSRRTTARARCLCGGIELRAALPPARVGHCHCANCQRAHGAGVWTWVTFDDQEVAATTGADLFTHYTSDTGATRGFCKVCGSTLTYASPRWPGTLDISLASFVDDVGKTPDHHNYVGEAPTWCPILDDLPQHETTSDGQ